MRVSVWRVILLHRGAFRPLDIPVLALHDLQHAYPPSTFTGFVAHRAVGIVPGGDGALAPLPGLVSSHAAALPHDVVGVGRWELCTEANGCSDEGAQQEERR